MKANILNPQSDKIIVNCSIRAMYASRFVKLKSALQKYCPDAALLLYSDYPDGCPTQYESQYAFKIHAIREAVNAGYRFVLWMDCAFIPRAPIGPVWEWIREHGWLRSAARRFSARALDQRFGTRLLRRRPQNSNGNPSCLLRACWARHGE